MRKFIFGVFCLFFSTVIPSPTVKRKKIKLDTNVIDNKSLPFGTTMLMRAACDDDVDQIKSILDQGAHIEVQDNHMGWTALVWAVACGSENAVKTLIERGANIHHKDEEERNLLEVAKIEGQQKMVKLLAGDYESGDESSYG